MRRMASRFAVLALMICVPAFAATTYHADPVKGSSDGDGSAARPWKTLEEVIAKGQLKTLAGGDTLVLHTGYHGTASFSGDNAATVTITAGEGQKPTLSRLTIPSGKNWCVRGLAISPSFAQGPYKGSIVSFGESGESSKITVEGCYIFTVEDASKWDAKEWIGANSGAYMGRNGRELVLRNNFIRNTRFGVDVSSFDSLCEGNVISDFSADAVRATRDGAVIQYNIIKNVYVSGADGDANHDDGIQAFLFAKGTGTVKNMKMIGNIIIAHEDPQQKLQNSLQGLGLFDGPLVNFVISDNVVNVDAYHGIAVYDGQNCLVERNVVWTPEGPRVRAWIMFGSKHKEAKDNIARDNFATSFRLREPGTVDERNEIVTAKIYEESLKKAYKTICDKFGAKHIAADRVRLVIK